LATEKPTYLKKQKKESNMNKVLWCPQHQITEEQKTELKGSVIIPLNTRNRYLMEELSALNVDSDIDDLVKFLSLIIDTDFDEVVLPIGSPHFMFKLAQKCVGLDVTFLFSYSKRVSEEKTVNGKTIKTSTFKHIKFLEV